MLSHESQCQLCRGPAVLPFSSTLSVRSNQQPFSYSAPQPQDSLPGSYQVSSVPSGFCTRLPCGFLHRGLQHGAPQETPCLSRPEKVKGLETCHPKTWPASPQTPKEDWLSTPGLPENRGATGDHLILPGRRLPGKEGWALLSSQLLRTSEHS